MALDDFWSCNLHITFNGTFKLVSPVYLFADNVSHFAIARKLSNVTKETKKGKDI